MHKVTLLSAALIAAATFATPVLASGNMKQRVSTTQGTKGDTCVRAPRVGAFATAPWTDAAPCEPNTNY